MVSGPLSSPYGGPPGLTNSPALNGLLGSVNQMGMLPPPGVPGAPGGAGPAGGGTPNLMAPGSPLDFAQNQLNPGVNNITSQINQALGSAKPQGAAGAPGAAEAEGKDKPGSKLGNAVLGAGGGAAVGAGIGTLIAPGPGTAIGAVAGGAIGGLVGLFK